MKVQNTLGNVFQGSIFQGAFTIEMKKQGLGGLGSPWTNLFMPNHTPLLNYYSIRGGFNESISPTNSFVNLWSPEDKRKNISIQCCGSWKNPTTGVVTNFNSTTSQSYTMKYVTPVATQMIVGQIGRL